jgi:formylglycine-generating enzyme required for sulfatase activity
MTTPDSPRVLRGGGWLISPPYCRSSFRYRDLSFRCRDQPDDYVDNFIGFRVVRFPRGEAP